MAFEPTPPRDVSFYGDPRDHGAKCDQCPLAGNVFVPYSAPTKKLRLVLVGEGPGRVECIRREPFTGPTGQILSEELSAVGLERDEAWVTNAAMCVGETDQENERAAECCAPRLLGELAALDPSVPIVAMGKAATRSVLGVKSILLARGFVWTARDLSTSVTAGEAALRKAQKEDKKVDEVALRLETIKRRNDLAGRTVFPALHPTFAFIHAEVWASHFRNDLDRVARWVRGELTEDMLADKVERVTSLSALRKKKRTFLVTDNVDEIRAAMKLLGKEVGCDIETERMKPLSPLLVQIFTVQISDGDRSIVIAPWDKARHAAVLSEVLKGRTTVWHNGFCFDSVCLEKDGVDLNGVQFEDTLTAHHSFASVFPQKLDHVVSTFLDSTPWKIRFGVRGAEEKGLAPAQGEEGDLEAYGATDAIVTIKAWRAMQADLAPERAVYEHDKRRSILYKSLQVAGYPVDRRRKRLLSKLLKRRAASLKGRLRQLARRPNFQPSKLGDVRHVLFHTLRAPMLNPTATGLASTSNATLESLRTGDKGDDTKETRVARFAEGLLNWRVALKSKNTYIDTVQVHPDGRAHYTFKPFGVITGRPASRILSVPRWSQALPERVREIYKAEPGRALLYFDLCFSAETMIDGPTGAKPIEKMRVGDLVYTYRKETRKPAIGKVNQVHHVGRAPVVKVLLDNGAVVRCTPDHKWMVCPRFQKDDPVERRADSLQFGDRLLPLRKIINRGSWKYPAKPREYLYAHSAAMSSQTHVEVARAVYGPRPEGHHVHHIDEDAMNNAPDNLEYKRAEDHISEHSKELALWQWRTPSIRRKMVRALRKATAEGRTAHFGKDNGKYNPDQKCTVCGKHVRYSSMKYCSKRCYGISRIKPRGPCAVCAKPVKRPGGMYCSQKCLGVGYSRGLNHRVISVTPDGCADVWSIGVDPDRNYALAAGVFVKNCQAEARFAANLSGDVNFINACLKDIHTANAKILFPDQKEALERDPKGKHCERHSTGGNPRAACNCGKLYRDVTKNAFFAIIYQAHPSKVLSYLRSQGFPSELGDVEDMFAAVRDVYADYDRYVKDNVRFVERNGFIRTAIKSRKIVIGFHPKPTDVSNLPIQSGIADVIDTRLLDVMVPSLPPGDRMILHHYDSATFDCDARHIEWKVEKGEKKPCGPLVEMIENCWKVPVQLKESIVCRGDREFLLPAEVKVGKRMSDF